MLETLAAAKKKLPDALNGIAIQSQSSSDANNRGRGKRAKVKRKQFDENKESTNEDAAASSDLPLSSDSESAPKKSTPTSLSSKTVFFVYFLCNVSCILMRLNLFFFRTGKDVQQ